MSDYEVILVSGEINAAKIPLGMNEISTFRIDRSEGKVQFEAAAAGAHPDGTLFAHPVVAGAIDYMRHLAQIMPGIREGAPVIVQCNDTPINSESIGWEARLGWKAIHLIPDLYYFSQRGYEGQLEEVPDWQTRRDIVGWRGATTGLPGFTANDLDRLPRYRLAKLGARLGERADIAISNVVQAPSEEEHHRIEERLNAEGLIRPYVPFVDFQKLRYIVDVQGNANAWNFIQKLRLGACVLRVGCDWHQWFDDRLIAWRHYIPISSDLSDFERKLEWCRDNPAMAEEVAAAGRQFAMNMRFDDEMQAAARTTFEIA